MYQRIHRKAKSEYYNNLFDKYATNIKETWHVLKEAIGLIKTVFRCLSPLEIENPHFFGMIRLNSFFMQDFQKQIGSVVLGPNHSGKFFLGKIWIFVKVTFFDPSEIGVLGLTWRVTLL